MEQWFEKRRKNKVLDLAHQQMTVALDTVNDLETIFKAVINKDKEKAKKTIERLFKVENEADELRRKVFEESVKGSLPSRDRESIMHLVKCLDVMADNVKDSARNLLILLDLEIPGKLWKEFYDMSSRLVRTAAVLRESIKNLGKDPFKARMIAETVEDEETKVDEKHLEIKSLLIEYGDKLNPSILLILKDLLDAIEDAADSCADTGDYVRILTVSYK